MSPGVANPPLLRMDPAAYAPVRNISIRRDFNGATNQLKKFYQLNCAESARWNLPAAGMIVIY